MAVPISAVLPCLEATVTRTLICGLPRPLRTAELASRVPARRGQVHAPAAPSQCHLPEVPGIVVATARRRGRVLAAAPLEEFERKVDGLVGRKLAPGLEGVVDLIGR